MCSDRTVVLSELWTHLYLLIYAVVIYCLALANQCHLVFDRSVFDGAEDVLCPLLILSFELQLWMKNLCYVWAFACIVVIWEWDSKTDRITFYSGISLKTQELYAIVFLTRYLDLFTEFISVYNTTMKVVFIASSVAIVWYMRFDRAIRRSYDRDLDTFRHYFLVGACFLLALLVNEKYSVQEVSYIILTLLKVLLS